MRIFIYIYRKEEHFDMKLWKKIIVIEKEINVKWDSGKPAKSMVPLPTSF
jgi:hypothetical protein